MKQRCFIDGNGTIWPIKENDSSTFPGTIQVEKDKVLILAPSDGEVGREILDEFTLWPSITALALAIEYPATDDTPDPVSLESAVGDTIRDALAFEENFRQEHANNPDDYPLTIPADNAGLWHELISDFTSDQD